jgi:hypothetical protein
MLIQSIIHVGTLGLAYRKTSATYNPIKRIP